jgi:hypothetical protein
LGSDDAVESGFWTPSNANTALAGLANATTGSLPVARGGTGATDAAGARINLAIPGTGTSNTYTRGQIIDGTADEVQSTIQGHSTQTANLSLWEESDGTDAAMVDPVGTGYFGGVDNSRLTPMGAALAKLNATGTTSQLRIILAGDSLAGNLYSHMHALLRDTIGIAGYTVGSPGDGTGTSTTSTGQFSTWVNGVYDTVTSGQRFVMCAPGSLDIIGVDSIKAMVVAESGGGTYKIQYKIGAGAWTDSGIGGDNISASNGTTSGSVTSGSVTRANMRVGIVGLTGSVKIIGMEARDSTSRGVIYGAITRGDTTVEQFNTVPTAVLNPIMASVAPDVMVWLGTDDVATYSAHMPAFYSRMNTASGVSTDWLWIGPNPISLSEASCRAQGAVLRGLAISNNESFFDGYTPYISYAAANAAGWMADGTHPSASGYGMLLGRLKQSLPIFGALRPQRETVALLTLASTGSVPPTIRTDAESATGLMLNKTLILQHDGSVPGGPAIILDDISGPTSTNDRSTIYREGNVLKIGDNGGGGGLIGVTPGSGEGANIIPLAGANFGMIGNGTTPFRGSVIRDMEVGSGGFLKGRNAGSHIGRGQVWASGAITAGATDLVTVGIKEQVRRYDIDAGAGTYTYNIDLDNTGAFEGATFFLRLDKEASANPTINVRSGSGGTVLRAINNVSAQIWHLAYTYDGAAWIEQSADLALPLQSNVFAPDVGAGSTITYGAATTSPSADWRASAKGTGDFIFFEDGAENEVQIRPGGSQADIDMVLMPKGDAALIFQTSYGNTLLSISPSNFFVIDPITGLESASFTGRVLYDSIGETSVAWGNRELSGPDGSSKLAWGNLGVNDFFGTENFYLTASQKVRGLNLDAGDAETWSFSKTGDGVLRSLTLSGSTLTQRGTSVASGATIDLSGVAGNVVQITGTTAVTNMSNLTVGNVYFFWSSDATGAVLTHGNNIFCTDDTNIRLSSDEAAVGVVVAANKILITPAFGGNMVSATVNSGSAVALTTATAANVTSISLPAGRWDVTYDVYFAGTSTTSTRQESSFGATSATLSTTTGHFVSTPFMTTLLSDTWTHSKSAARITVSSTTTYYLVARATFSAGTMSAFGEIRARRSP